MSKKNGDIIIKYTIKHFDRLPRGVVRNIQNFFGTDFEYYMTNLINEKTNLKHIHKKSDKKKRPKKSDKKNNESLKEARRKSRILQELSDRKKSLTYALPSQQKEDEYDEDEEDEYDEDDEDDEDEEDEYKDEDEKLLEEARKRARQKQQERGKNKSKKYDKTNN